MNAVRKLAHLPGNAITAFQRVENSEKNRNPDVDHNLLVFNTFKNNEKGGTKWGI